MAQGIVKGFARRTPPVKRPNISASDDNQGNLGKVQSLKIMSEEGQDAEANNYPAQRRSKQNRRGPQDNKSVSIMSKGKGRAGR
jgi:hypothetical protein